MQSIDACKGCVDNDGHVAIGHLRQCPKQGLRSKLLHSCRDIGHTDFLTVRTQINQCKVGIDVNSVNLAVGVHQGLETQIDPPLDVLAPTLLQSLLVVVEQALRLARPFNAPRIDLALNPFGLLAGNLSLNVLDLVEQAAFLSFKRTYLPDLILPALLRLRDLLFATLEIRLLLG